MRKLFLFLFAALMSVGMFAATEVTITQNDFPRSGKSFTKDGVTVSAGSIDGSLGNLVGPGSFSTTLGNFTQIEVSANDESISGPGWAVTNGKKTWRGKAASSVSFGGNIMGNGQGVTLKFTIADPTVAVTGVTLNQNEAQMTVGGETLTLTATVNPDNATNKNVSWSTSDANVATVKNGVVTAVAAGTATITVTTTDGYFTATCAVTVTAPEPQGETTVVTITDSDFPGWGDSFTKDGVTVSAEMIDDMYGNISGPGSFSTTLGNFTKIEVNANYVSSLGPGWSGDSERQTWTGNASSVSFTGDINGDEEGLTLKFTIEPASTPEPQPAGQVITWDFFFCNEVTAMCDDGATIALDNSKDGISVTYGGYDDMDGWGGGYIYLYGASESKMIFSSTVGDISKIEIYYSDNIGGTPADWTLDATNNKFVWEGTPAASVDMKKGTADNIGFAVDHIVFTIAGSTPTAVENVQTNHVQATKFFRDGQLLIEKNGKIYNVQGVEVK